MLVEAWVDGVLWEADPMTVGSRRVAIQEGGHPGGWSFRSVVIQESGHPEGRPSRRVAVH